LGVILVFVSGFGSAMGLHLLVHVARRVDEYNEDVAASNADAATKQKNYIEPSYFAAAQVSYPVLAVRQPTNHHCANDTNKSKSYSCCCYCLGRC
jgi:hypothetical protein